MRTIQKEANLREKKENKKYFQKNMVKKNKTKYDINKLHTQTYVFVYV